MKDYLVRYQIVHIPFFYYAESFISQEYESFEEQRFLVRQIKEVTPFEL